MVEVVSKIISSISPEDISGEIMFEASNPEFIMKKGKKLTKLVLNEFKTIINNDNFYLESSISHNKEGFIPDKYGWHMIDYTCYILVLSSNDNQSFIEYLVENDNSQPLDNDYINFLLPLGSLKSNISKNGEILKLDPGDYIRFTKTKAEGSRILFQTSNNCLNKLKTQTQVYIPYV